MNQLTGRNQDQRHSSIRAAQYLTERIYGMQDKPDSPISQSSSKARRATEPIKASSPSPGAAANTTPGAGAQSAGVIDQAKETLSNVTSQAGDKVVSRIDSQKDRAADGLGSVAQALRQTGDQLREQDQATGVHQYIASAADQVDRFAEYLRSTNVSQMVNKVEQIARRQPAIFVGGAFVLGLLGARFLKSSGQAGFSQTGSIPRDESLVPRGDYTGAASFGRNYPGSVGTSGVGTGNIGTGSVGTGSTGTGSTGTGSAGYRGPLDVPPVRRGEDF
jgi:uncharacterized protein YukE